MNEVTDVERFRWLLAHPGDARHLFLLLSQGRGDKDALITLLDKVIKSESAAIRPKGEE